MTKKLRRVRVFDREYNEEKYRHETFPDGEAWFHQFSITHQEIGGTPAHFPVAIIERDSGSVRIIDAVLIEFIDPPEVVP